MLTLCLEISEDIEKFPQADLTANRELEEAYIEAIEQECIFALIITLCEMMGESDLFQFKVGGFGLDSWPVDVTLHLSTVIEQVTDVIDSIREERYPVELDFYEQGMQRTLVFEKGNSDNLLRITCYSRTSWVPEPASILTNKDDILSQLVTLKSSFVRAVKKLFPGLSEIDFFTEWCET